MRKLIATISLTSALILGAAPLAHAIDRGQARAVTAEQAQDAAAIGQGTWNFAGIILNMVGPQGGSIEWVGHFTLYRYGPSFQTCTGYVELGNLGGVHGTHISCVDDPNNG
jgi:hypothetical protein